MCACGCLLLLVVAAGIAWCILQGLWVIAVLIAVAVAVLGWFSRKLF